MNHCGTWKIIITSIDFIQCSSFLQGFTPRTIPLQMKYTVSASFLLPPSSTFLLFPWSYGLLICVGRNVVVFEQSGKWWLRMDYWHRRGIVASFPWLWTLNFRPEGNKGTMEVIFAPPLCIFPFPGIQFNFFPPRNIPSLVAQSWYGGGDREAIGLLEHISPRWCLLRNLRKFPMRKWLRCSFVCPYSPCW